MDEKLLNSLNNLSISLIEIANSLNQKGSETSDVHQSLVNGNFGEILVDISTKLTSIKTDTSEIIKIQNSILATTQRLANIEIKERLDAIRNNQEQVNDKDSDVDTDRFGLGKILSSSENIKAGTTSIMLIAGSVLALGAAFQLIGDVDPISVVTLTGSLYFLTDAFAKIGHLNITPQTALNTGLLIASMATALMISSHILQGTANLSTEKIISAVGVAGMFTVVAFGIKNILGALGDVDNNFIQKVSTLPILMPAISLGIAMSTWALSMVTPISLEKGLTSIMVAGTFTAMAFGMKKIIESLDITKNPGLMSSLMALPLAMPAIALGIAGASWALNMVTPVSMDKGITSIMVAGVFTAMAFGLKPLIASMKPEDIPKYLLLPIAMPLIAGAIALSSKILVNTEIISPNQAFSSVLMAGLFVVWGGTAWVLSKMGAQNIVSGSLAILAVAGSIALSSHIIASGDYSVIPSLPWVLGAGASILAFGLVAGGLGALITATGGVFGLALIAGGLSILGISKVIAETSHILKEGDYSVNIPLGFALGAGASLLAFGLAQGALGLFALTGIGLKAIEAGGVAVISVADSIVQTSKILATGNYSGGPTLAWASATGITLSAFGLATATLGTMMIASFGLGDKVLDLGKQAILGVATSIAEVSHILGKGNYSGGPTFTWARGIATALGGFAPIYGMLVADKVMSIFGGGISPADFSKAIKTVSLGIVESAKFFAENKSAFVNGPSKEWAEGVGTAIGAFAPVYKALSDSGFWSAKVSPEDMKEGILTISDGIIIAAEKFSKNMAVFDVTRVPSKLWGDNVGSSIQAFAPVMKFMSDESGWFGVDIKELSQGITTMVSSMIRVARLFNTVQPSVWNASPSREWSGNLETNMKDFSKVIATSGDISVQGINRVNRNINTMVSIARRINANKRYFEMNIDPNFIADLSKNTLGFANLAKDLTNVDTGSTLANLTGTDSISTATKGMIKLAKGYDVLSNSLRKFGSSLDTINESKVDVIRRLTGNMAVLSAMSSDNFEQMLEHLESKTDMFSKLVDISNSREKVEIKTPTISPTGQQMKSNAEINSRLDKIIQFLSAINSSTNGLDEFIEGAGKVSL